MDSAQGTVTKAASYFRNLCSIVRNPGENVGIAGNCHGLPYAALVVVLAFSARATPGVLCHPGFNAHTMHTCCSSQLITPGSI